MPDHSYFDLHVHSTDGSDDAGATVEGYCKWVEARRKNGYHVDGFVLTEHRRYLDDADYSALAQQYDVTILRGIEVETDVGHVLVYGVTPDLLAYGKALGGGFPIAALGGRADVMDEVREDRHETDRYVWAASTTGGGPVTSAAAHAVLDVLGAPGAYEHLFAMGARLRDGIAATFAKRGIAAQVYGQGPLAQFQLTDIAVVDMQSETTGDRKRRREIDLELVRLGIFINPMLTKIYVSLAHDAAAVDAYLEALDAAIA